MNKKRWPKKETDLCKVLIGVLKAKGVEVKSELGNRDIVARWPDANTGEFVYTIIEATREGITLDKLAQAESRLGEAHYVAIACPPRPMSRGRVLAFQWGSEKGISFIEISEHGTMTKSYTKISNKVNAGPLEAEFDAAPEVDYAPAGRSGGAMYTQRNGFRDAAATYIEEYPGCKLRDVTRDVDFGTEFRSPQAAASWLKQEIGRNGLGGRVEIRKKAGVGLAYPRESVSA